MKKIFARLGALGVGLINGLLGAGGGMLAVPLLRTLDIPTQKTHATSIAVILPLSTLSAILYLTSGRVEIAAALPYLPAGIVGALLGVWLLPRMPAHILRRIFGGFIIWAAVRLFI